MQIVFGLQSYQHASLPLSSQRMLNAYLEPAPPNAKTSAAVVPSFGIKPLLNVGTGPIRGGFYLNGIAYVVSGVALYSIDISLKPLNLGVIPGGSPVFMEHDGHHLMIVSAGSGYLWDGSTLSEITDPNFPGYQWLTYLDGYMIGGPGDGTFYINHTAFDPTGWNALDFESTESFPDFIMTGIVDHRELFLFGRQKAEVWYNSGNADFPLSRTASGYMEIGTTSRWGPAKIDNTIYFPANDGTVRRVDGYTPIRISQTAMEQAIAKYAPQEPLGFTWIENGHSMYGLTYKEGTWVFDISTQLWHERQSYGFSNWRPAFIMRGANVTYVGDRLSNRVGTLDAQTYAEWDQPLVSEVTAPSVAQDNQLIPHASLELIFEQGVGLSSGQGSDPTVGLQWSDDGGRTWGHEIRRPLGKAGEFRRTALFNRLGQSRDRVYRYRVSDNVRRTLIQAILKNAA